MGENGAATLATAAALVGLLLLIPASASALERDNRCLKWADRYRVEVQTRYGVLFTKRAGSQAPGERLWYGCIFSVERARRLPGQDPAGPPVSSVGVATLEGRYAQYGLEREEAPGRVIVYDIKQGGPGTALNTHAGADENTEAEVRSIVGNRRGSVAWISEEPGNPPTRGVYVWSTFDEIVVRNPDRGTEIPPESLARARDRVTIYWLNAGQPRSSPLD